MSAPVAVGLAVLATLFFGLSTVLIRARVRDATPIVALAISLTINVLVLWPISLAFYDVGFNLWQWRYFVLAGTFAPVLARFFNYSGMDRLGVNIAAPITFAHPVVSVTLALAFLGERISAIGLLGGLFVIGGGVVLGSADGDGPASFDRRFLVLPVLAAVCYGLSHAFRKVGITLVDEPVVAAAVTATTSWALLVGYLAVTRRPHDLSVSRDSIAFFSAAGLSTSVGIPVLYLALQLGALVVVAPILNTTPLFVLGLSFLLFRGEELFTARVVGGTVSIVVGVITLSTYGTV